MDTAQKTFELNNNVELIDPLDELYRYSREEEQALVNAEPWKQDPHYFHTVKISAVALIKMVIHARSGGAYEIMGVMYGKVRDGTFWIMDAAALPVQGTETRVNAGNEAFEYMVQFQDSNRQAGKEEMLRGWYHSHPGYGCWLSGIDVGTQTTNQKFSDPYLAVVIDPNRTVSAGKLEIGAFRTYPEGYTPPAASKSQYQSVPMDKIEDFGVHADSYYQLKIEIYKTKMDEHILNLLWNKYWVSTLSQSLLVSNRPFATSQIRDLAEKLNAAADSCEKNQSHITITANKDKAEGSKGKKASSAGEGVTAEDQETPISKAAKEGGRIAAEAQNGMLSQVLKDRLFNTPLTTTLTPEQAKSAAQGAS